MCTLGKGLIRKSQGLRVQFYIYCMIILHGYVNTIIAYMYWILLEKMYNGWKLMTFPMTQTICHWKLMVCVWGGGLS